MNWGPRLNKKEKWAGHQSLSLSASSFWVQCVQLCLCCYAFLVGSVGLHSPTVSAVKPFFLRSPLSGTLSQPWQEWLVHWAIITHRCLMNTLGTVLIFILYILRKTLPTNTYRWIFHCLKPFHNFFLPIKFLLSIQWNFTVADVWHDLFIY